MPLLDIKYVSGEAELFTIPEEYTLNSFGGTGDFSVVWEMPDKPGYCSVLNVSGEACASVYWEGVKKEMLQDEEA